MRWNYDLFDCLRYEYPNEPRGPEHPNIPPIPPAGWPLPRVGEVLTVDQNDDRFTPFKARVIGVEWDYAVPRVTVQLEAVREQNTDDQNDVIRQAKAEAWDEGAEAAWGRSTPEVNGARYHWRSAGEPVNPYEQGDQP